MIEPLREPIMQRALLEVVLLGIAGGALGGWVVTYRLSYGAESLAHALLPGLVLASALGLPLVVGGAAGLAVAALAVALATRLPGVERDAATGVAVTSLLGLGVLLALAPDTPTGLGELLFGDVLGVTDTDLLVAAGLALVVVGALWLLHGRLLVVGLDRSSAAGLGVRAPLVDAALLLLLAAAILVAVQGLGNLLVVAVLVAPACAARLVTRRMGAMLATSALVAVLGGVGGLYLSYYAGVASGAAIAGVLVAAYAVLAARGAVVRRRGTPRTIRAA